MQTWLLDVTHDALKREVAQRMCVESYCQLYGSDPAQSKATDLWPESRLIGSVPYYMTLMVLGRLEKDAEGKPLATVTCRLGSRYDGGEHPMEFMRYMIPEDGWDGLASRIGFDPRKTLEISMFAFSAELSRPEDQELRIRLFRELHSAVLAFAPTLGCTDYLSILAKPFARFVKIHCHLPCATVDGVSVDTEACAKLIKGHPGYWIKGRPGLYRTRTPGQESKTA